VALEISSRSKGRIARLAHIEVDLPRFGDRYAKKFGVGKMEH